MSEYSIQALKNLITEWYALNHERRIDGIVLQERTHDLIDSLARVAVGSRISFPGYFGQLFEPSITQYCYLEETCLSGLFGVKAIRLRVVAEDPAMEGSLLQVKVVSSTNVTLAQEGFSLSAELQVIELLLEPHLPVGEMMIEYTCPVGFYTKEILLV